MVKGFVDRAGWAAVVGLCATAVTSAVFAVALVLAMLCEFIVTGGIGETVGESFVTTGGRICGATSLLAFVVGFVVAWAPWGPLWCRSRLPPFKRRGGRSRRSRCDVVSTGGCGPGFDATSTVVATPHGLAARGGESSTGSGHRHD